jgi:hypothetical protein
MLAALSTTRRGRRAATRNPSSRGTGRRAEIAISQGVDGARAGRADGGNESRDCRDPECHGQDHADRGHGEGGRACAADEAGTGIGEQGGGEPSGRQSDRRREQGQGHVLGEQHDSDEARSAADRFEQSDASGLVGHPAADEDRDAGHGEQSEQPAASPQDFRRVLDHLVVPVADVLPRLQGWCGPARREAIVDERRRVGRVGQLQVHDVGEIFLRGGETAGVRLGEPDQAGLDRLHGRLGIDGRLFPWRATTQLVHGLEHLGAGQAVAHIRIWPRGGGDRHADNLERAAVGHTTVWLLAANHEPTYTCPQGDFVPDAEFERVGEAGFDDHSAVAYPAALAQLGLVDRGRCGVAALCPHPRSTQVLPAQVSSGDAVRLEFHPEERVRPAVVGDAGSVGQRLERGEVGGLTEERIPSHTGHDVGPACGRPGALVGLVGHPVQDEPECDRGRGSHDRQQKERGFCGAPA